MLYQIGGDADFDAMVAVAGPRAFPGLQVIRVAKLSDATAANNGGTSYPDGALLVLSEPTDGALAEAQAEADGSGLPRWAVVHFSSRAAAGSGVDLAELASSPAAVELIARELRFAWERHGWQRENARLRGDLLTFGSRIAHDLRTPLGGVVSTAEMLQEILTEDAPANVPLVQPILDSTYGLVTLIERTSFFARSVGSNVPRKLFEMGTPFWHAFQQMESMLLKAGATLSYPPTWPRVEAHETWFEAVWRILLTNAVQHRAPGTAIEAGWTAEADGHRFWMRNAGTVPVQKRSTLFFPFHRLHEPGAPRGLGLPIIQRLVELEGGHCGFTESEAGQVEFFFWLRTPSVDLEGSGSTPRGL